MKSGNHPPARMPTYPDQSVQNLTGGEWWSHTESQDIRRGRLIWAYIPHVEIEPWVLALIKRIQPTSHSNATYRLRRQSVFQPKTQSELPVAAWPAFKNEHLPILRGFHDHLANQCSFSADGRYLVSSGSDYTARIWSVPEMRLVGVCIGHTDDIEMSVFHPSGDVIATCSRDHDIRIFKIDGTPMTRLQQGHTADVISVAWVSDGDRLVSSSDDGTIRHWDGKSGALLETHDLRGIETDTIVITEKGTVFSGNDAGEILTIKGGQITKTSAHEAGIKRIAYRETDKLLVSLSYDR